MASDWGSVADWVSGVATAVAVAVALGGNYWEHRQRVKDCRQASEDEKKRLVIACNKLGELYESAQYAGEFLLRLESSAEHAFHTGAEMVKAVEKDLTLLASFVRNDLRAYYFVEAARTAASSLNKHVSYLSEDPQTYKAMRHLVDDPIKEIYGAWNSFHKHLGATATVYGDCGDYVILSKEHEELLSNSKADWEHYLEEHGDEILARRQEIQTSIEDDHLKSLERRDKRPH